MTANPSPGTPLVRPIRPDRLDRGDPQLRTRLDALDLSGPDSRELSRGILAVAAITRTYVEGVRALLRARSADKVQEAMASLRSATEKLEETIDTLTPLLERVRDEIGDGKDLDGLVDVWSRGGGPRELAHEGRLRSALTEHLSTWGRVRKSDLAHLACLWSDSQRYHAALRGLLDAPPTRPNEVVGFLEALITTMFDHILAVDLHGLPGDPGLLDGIPAMIDRLRGTH